MILLVFLNEHDKQSHIMGRELPSFLRGDYVKIFTRYKSNQYEYCDVKNTLNKIREFAQVFDKVIVSFGLRLFPPEAYKTLVTECKNAKKSTVFLKELKGSKTWSIVNNKLSFDNKRIADTGLFIFKAEDLLNSKSNSFNSFLKELIKQDKLDYKFVSYWLFTSPKQRRVK